MGAVQNARRTKRGLEMKRIMLDVPDLTSFIAITYIYEDEVTWSQMAGVSVITRADDPAVFNGEKAYVILPSDQRVDND